MTDTKLYYQQTVDSVLGQLASHRRGLSVAEAERRLQQNGPNVLHRPAATHPNRLLRTDPLGLTLLASAIISAALREYTATLAILVAAYVHGASLLSLTRRNHRFLQHLQHKLTSRQTVLRSGKRMEIDSHELVLGDVICLAPGGFVPADVRVIQAKRLVTDESSLTGNPQLARKSTAAIRPEIPLAEQRNLLFAGSGVISGEGLGLVVATGSDTVLARQAHDTSASALLVTPLHQNSRRVKTWFYGTLAVTLAGLAIAAIELQLQAPQFWDLAVLAAVAMVPAGLTAELVVFSQVGAANSPKRQAAILHVLRSAAADSGALFCLAILSIVGMLSLHVPPALVVVQLVAFQLLAQPLPIAALSWDEWPRPLRYKRLTTPMLHELIIASLTAAAAAYANFVFFFARHHVALSYMNNDSVLYAHATTVALVTLVLCQGLNILFVRAHEHDSFFGNFLLSNKRLLGAFASAAVLVLCMIYLPWPHTWLNTQPLDVIDWLSVIALALLYAGVRLLQRHTRQHTRHAVLQLHRDLGLLHSIK